MKLIFYKNNAQPVKGAEFLLIKKQLAI